MEREGMHVLATALRGSSAYLEFGAGGSTVLAMELGVPRIHSVDSDRGLLEALLKRSAGTGSRLLAYHCDLGETVDWGFPRGKESVHTWPSYSSAVWKLSLIHI